MKIQDSFVFFLELGHSIGEGFQWLSESLILHSKNDDLWLVRLDKIESIV